MTEKTEEQKQKEHVQQTTHIRHVVNHQLVIIQEAAGSVAKENITNADAVVII